MSVNDRPEAEASRIQSRADEHTAAHIQARADKGRAWQEIQELWEQAQRANEDYRRNPIAGGYAHQITTGCKCSDCVERRHEKYLVQKAKREARSS